MVVKKRCMVLIDIFRVLCLFSSLVGVHGIWNCGWGVGSASYACSKTSAPHPSGVFVDPRRPGSVLNDAMTLFVHTYNLWQRYFGGPAMGVHGQTFYTVPADRIPYRSNAMTNPNFTATGNCEPDCVLDVFAPIGDVSAIEVAENIFVKGWAFWYNAFVMIWGASSNALFDVHCGYQCISVHPSRKKYFQHGLDNIQSNATVVFISNPTIESVEVIVPVRAMLMDQRDVKPENLQLPATNSLSGVAIFLERILGNVSSMLVATSTGDAENVVAELGIMRWRPGRLLVMNTRIRSGYGTPENQLDPRKFVSTGTTALNFKTCTVEPIVHNFGLPGESRHVHLGISRGTLLEQWRVEHPELLEGPLGAMAVKAVGAFQHFANVDAGWIGWASPETRGQISGDKFESDAVMDDSVSYYSFSWGLGGFSWEQVYAQASRIWFSTEIDYRFRSYALRVACAPPGAGVLEFWPYRLASQNPFQYFMVGVAYVAGKAPPPEYAQTPNHCYSVLGSVDVNMAKGSWNLGMWLQQDIEGVVYILKPTVPAVWVGGSFRNLMYCAAWSTTTTTTSTTSIANLALHLTHPTATIVFLMIMRIGSRI